MKLRPNLIVRLLAKLMRPIWVECWVNGGAREAGLIAIARKVADGTAPPLPYLLEQFPELGELVWRRARDASISRANPDATPAAVLPLTASHRHQSHGTPGAAAPATASTNHRDRPR